MDVPGDADRDFVAGALIIEDEELLLIDHGKYGIWLPPGGHVEERETTSEAAVREALEETGIEVEIIEDRDSIDQEGYHGRPRPFNVNLHRVKDGHWHLDFLYRTRIVNRDEASHGHEHNGMKWFSEEDLRDESYDIPEYIRKVGLKALES